MSHKRIVVTISDKDKSWLEAYSKKMVSPLPKPSGGVFWN